MFSDEIIEFLERPLPAHLATLNPSGSPQLTAMGYLYEDGDLLFSTLTNRAKYRNVTRDPRVAVTIMDSADILKWVIINGSMTVADLDPVEVFHRIAVRYETSTVGRHVPVMTDRTVLRLTPTTFRTMGF